MQLFGEIHVQSDYVNEGIFKIHVTRSAYQLRDEENSAIRFPQRKKQGNAPGEGGNQQICKWMPSAADCSARSVQCVISITNQSLGDFLFLWNVLPISGIVTRVKLDNARLFVHSLPNEWLCLTVGHLENQIGETNSPEPIQQVPELRLG